MHQATKSKMRFFSRKKTQDRKGTTQQLKPIISSGTESSSSGAVENRTDVAIKKQQDGTREKSISANAAAESKKVVRSPKKSTNKPAKQTSNNNNRTTTKTPIIEKKDKASISPKKQQRQSTAKKAPVSILHKNRHTTAKQDVTKPSEAIPTRSTGFTFASPPAPQDTSPYHNRVRFLSSGSAASTEASQVHLMGLGGHSVASSSAMSSSADHPRENVFDRVLNMVMKEENVRLNAMGMSSYGAAPESMHANITPAASKAAAKKKQDRADAKAKKAIAKLGIRSSSSKNRDLGLSPPGRTDLAPIDMDTGLEIGANFDAPIDMDTGLEVQYHDLNDDDVDEERWQKLNDAAKLSSKLASGMKGVNVKKSRSYDHNRKPGSSPTNRFRRSNSGGGGSSKHKRSSPNKKEKDEWVSFDSASSPSIKDRMRRSLQGKSHPDEEAF